MATIYQRIQRAAKADKGVRLTAEEVFELSNDTAMIALAEQDDDADIDRKADAKMQRECRRHYTGRESGK